jgi:general secretion pathway protein L
MSAQGVKLSEITSRITAWLEGVSSQIIALVPAGIRAAFHPSVPVIALDATSDGLTIRRIDDGASRIVAHASQDEFDADWLRSRLLPLAGKFLRDPVVLRLPDDIALERTIVLPRAARARLDEILRHELARQSPVDAAEVYYDFRCRRGAMLDVTLRIVKRDRLDRLLATCRAAGVAVAAVSLVGDSRPADGGNFPVEAPAAKLLRLRRQQVPALVLLVLVLAFGLVVGAYLRQQAATADLNVRLDEARAAAQSVMRLQHEIAAADKRAAFLVGQKRKPLLLDVIAETTRILPQGSWLTEIQVRGREVEITGYSNAAPSLIAIADASPKFSDAQFRSPLIKVPGSDAERFDLSFTVRGAK